MRMKCSARSVSEMAAGSAGSDNKCHPYMKRRLTASGLRSRTREPELDEEKRDDNVVIRRVNVVSIGVKRQIYLDGAFWIVFQEIDYGAL